MQQQDAPVVQEVRYAVVMYGGISLAIYMNGIAQELLSLVKSTATVGEGDDSLRYSDLECDRQGTPAVYRDLARFLIRKPALLSVAKLRNRSPQVRFNVDILSGTSAGGINGMFLAKALANGIEDLKVLEEMWIEEGDIGLLLNDKGSLRNLVINYDKIPNPTSLLNSDRMYDRLNRALAAMERDTSRPFTKRVDLFMTATDLRGLTKKIQLSDREVEERKHNTVFHFDYQHLGGNSFLGANNPFLAFVARCTSCIVPAFEPMRLSDIERTVKEEHRKYESWSQFFGPYWREQLSVGIDPKAGQDRAKEEFRSRSFGDGGYLDNRPFTYATKTLASRPSDLPVRRKLLYIEPDPVDVLDQGPEARPTVLDHALKAMTLASNEAIRDDLEAVRKRNELLDRTVRILEHVEAYSRYSTETGEANRWRVDLKETPASGVEKRSPAQLGYMHLRVSSVTDHLAAHLAGRLGFDEDSVYRTCVRHLVRHWRDSVYEKSDRTETEGSDPTRFGNFLAALDFGFEERRIQFLHRKINRLFTAEDEPTPEFTRDMLELKKQINAFSAALQTIKNEFLNGTIFSAVGNNTGLSISLPELSEIIKAPTNSGRADAARRILESKPLWPLIKSQLTEQATMLEKELGEYRKRFSEAFETRNSEPGPLQDNFLSYELFDELILPVTYGTGAIESNFVEVHRISPLDAPSLVPGRMATVEDHPLMRSKLVGTSLGHFGAFFDRGGRARDILWGRLDAAERLITTLIPPPLEDRNFSNERQHFIRRAQLAILCDAPTIPEGGDPQKFASEQRDMDRLRLHLFQKILDRPLAENADEPAIKRWILDSEVVLSDSERAKLICTLFELMRRRTDPLPSVRSGPRLPLRVATSEKVALSGRSLSILGRLFDGLYTSPRWRMVSWAGSVLSGIGQVLVPGSFDSAVGRHWYWLGVTFAGAITLLGVLLTVDILLRIGLTGILGLLLLGGIMRWLRGIPTEASVTNLLRRAAMLTAALAIALFFGAAAYAVAQLPAKDFLATYKDTLAELFRLTGFLAFAFGLLQFAILARRKSP